jgi:acid phosphatase
VATEIRLSINGFERDHHPRSLTMDRAFDRIFIIMLENELESVVLMDDYMRSLQGRGVRLSNYHGVTHPSQPNYFAAVTGLPMVADDNCKDIEATSVVDLLEAKGLTWRAYMEDLPEDDKAICISADRLYWRKHNAFVSLNNIRNNPERLARIVNARRLKDDLEKGDLPAFCWYTPNIQNDGHSPPDASPLHRWTGVAFLSQWLQGFLEPLLANPVFMKGTLVVVTFDESFPPADNHIYTALLGGMVKPGTVEADLYDHYSLLRTIEENFALGTLNRNDLTASWFRFLWGLKPPAFRLADHVQ